MATIQHPYYPIIYVRGYAGTQAEVEDTTSDPYNGFNIGSTRLRQHWTGECKRYYFESPLVRLMKDHGYKDVYDSGDEMADLGCVSPKSIFIYRYYDRTSADLGDGRRLSIQEAAAELSELILRAKKLVCGAADDKAFRVYLVAHSMGGLVCRCFLQNDAIGNPEARALVDKVFTYATPHNGIDMHILGNVPEFFSQNDVNNFNRETMRTYLALPPEANGEQDAASLNGKFDPNRFFCLVGTNHKDYAAAYGWSRRFVGPMSDGLVRIVNAATSGKWPASGSDAQEVESPRAFVHRSHSGYYGIVNSEEGYQNLIRFLFGDVRVDARLEVSNITLPPKVEKERASGKEVRASYHFEVIARVRGKLWDLHRRTVNEDSAIFRTFDEMLRPDKIAPGASPRHPTLFSLFLAKGQIVNPRGKSLGFSLDLGILVPQYEVAGVLWFKDHFEGGYLFRDKINLEAFPPGSRADNPDWVLYYGFDSKTPNRATLPAPSYRDESGIHFRIGIAQNTRPGIEATLVLTGIPWNQQEKSGT